MNAVLDKLNPCKVCDKRNTTDCIIYKQSELKCPLLMAYCELVSRYDLFEQGYFDMDAVNLASDTAIKFRSETKNFHIEPDVLPPSGRTYRGTPETDKWGHRICNGYPSHCDNCSNMDCDDSGAYKESW